MVKYITNRETEKCVPCIVDDVELLVTESNPYNMFIPGSLFLHSIEDVGFPPPNIYHRRDSPDGGDRGPGSPIVSCILEDYRLRLCRWTREREKSVLWSLFG